MIPSRIRIESAIFFPSSSAPEAVQNAEMTIEVQWRPKVCGTTMIRTRTPNLAFTHLLHHFGSKRQVMK